MATKVPISVENIAFERLNLSRHYLTIDCDFTCFLVLNPSGQIPSEGTDICALHVGAWQIDAWTLLTKKDFPNQAGFSACLVWDKTLVIEGSTSAPQVVESDIDTANSVSTLKGQPVNITGFSMPVGESLPTSLVLGAGDEAISAANPLPVVNYYKLIKYQQVYVGYPLPEAVLRAIGAFNIGGDPDNDNYVWVCSPEHFMTLDPNDFYNVSAFYRDKFFSSGGNVIVQYPLAYAKLYITVGSDYIIKSLRINALYSNNGSNVLWSNYPSRVEILKP